MKKNVLALGLAVLSFSALAYEAKVPRGMMAPNLADLIEKATAESGTRFQLADFQLVEDRELATSQYKMYVQSSEFIPVAGTAIRIWSDKKTGELILAEMHLDEKTKTQKSALSAKYKRAKFSPFAMKSAKLSNAIKVKIAGEVSKHGTDSRILGMKFNDVWLNGDLVRQVEVRGRRGVHHISVSLFKNEITESSYTEFPQSEQFQTLKANVFPIYEEVESTKEILPSEVRDLKYVKNQIPDGGADPFSVLRSIKHPENRYHPILSRTEIGRLYNFWSEENLREESATLVAQMKLKNNAFASGLLLQGKYANINLHPAIKEQLKGVEIPLTPSTGYMLSWVQDEETGDYEAVPLAGFNGKAITSAEDLLARLPIRLPDHNPIQYINSGVDEVQVYYAVTALMDSLQEMGFADPELSAKAFEAFLYDPDISMKDNAYYYDNTINFTTYSPEAPNYARDNPTIWHELGHGVMDRLMGPHLGFADSKGGYGGLSEGMADFVAQLVIHHQTNSGTFPGMNDFRIINNTGFYLTNEFHDEGEAYGGTMNDFLQMVIETEGREGLFRVSDLTLEAMRLTRNHPALSASSWFEHMLYADELGSDIRTPGMYKERIVKALATRNFSFEEGFQSAKMKVSFNGVELTNSSDASRDKPIVACDESGVISYDLKLQITEGDSSFIKFPATVKVEYQKGALQGAIHWEGEAANPEVYMINSADEVLSLPIKASMKCDSINQPDGSCKDYAYVQIYKDGVSKPIAKKRFYLKIKDQASCK